jgi:hypothetical protein
MGLMVTTLEVSVRDLFEKSIEIMSDPRRRESTWG